MRIWEILFLSCLFLYHAILLVPKRNRNFIFNFLIFFVALFGIVFLWHEGLRWQNLPAFTLLIIDLLILVFTFKGLKSKRWTFGFFSAVRGLIRALSATIGFVIAAASLIAVALFPLPYVSLEVYPVAVRNLVFNPPGKPFKPITLVVWYPSFQSNDTAPRWVQTPEAWNFLEQSGGPPFFFSSYLEYLPSSLSQGGQLSQRAANFPVIVFLCPENRRPQEWSFLIEYLASQGFVVAALSSVSSDAPSAPLYRSLLHGLDQFQLARLREPSPVPDNLFLEPALTLYALRQLNQDTSDFFYHKLDLDRKALLSLTAFSQEIDQHFKTSVWLGSSSPQTLKKNVIRRLFIPYQKMNEPNQHSLPTGAQFWEVGVAGLSQADLSDSAFLRPYLFYLGDKSRLDNSLHFLVREYVGAWLQFALLDGDPSLFEEYITIEGVSLKKSP